MTKNKRKESQKYSVIQIVFNDFFGWYSRNIIRYNFCNIEFGTKNYPSTSVPIPFVITPEGWISF